LKLKHDKEQNDADGTELSEISGNETENSRTALRNENAGVDQRCSVLERQCELPRTPSLSVRLDIFSRRKCVILDISLVPSNVSLHSVLK
jgi:hypothetical protein